MTTSPWQGRSIHFCLTNPQDCYVCNPNTGEPIWLIWNAFGIAKKIRLIRVGR